MTNERIMLNVLIDVLIKHNKRTEVANRYDISIGTVRNLCKKYEHLTDSLLDISDKYGNDDAGLYNFFYFERTLTRKKSERKVKSADIDAIEKCCKRYFYCYLDPVDVCKSICESKGIEFEQVKNYNSNRIETDAYCGDFRKDLLRTIRKIRTQIKPQKNHYEVFCQYSKTEQYRTNPISYGTFYLYAKKYWQDITWDRPLSDFIDDVKK